MMEKLISCILAMGIIVSAFAGCNSKKPTEQSSQPTNESLTVESSSTVSENADKPVTDAEVIDGLTFVKTMELKYAQKFRVDYYNDGYKLITITDNDDNKQKALIIPEGKEAPTQLKDGIIKLKQPLNNILMSSTPTTSLFNSLGALDKISMTTTDYDGWYIDEVKAAMDNKTTTFIGSYKEPDYEIIVEKAPQLGVFSTMLLSVPEVAEKLTELNVPYLLDQASYEPHPMARVEWIKLYGAMFNMEEKADEEFLEQCEYFDKIQPASGEKETAAIFYITSKGVLHVRKGGDYLSKMYEMAGGEYIFKDLEPEDTGTTKMEFEEFYKVAKDADRIIYIWNIGGKPKTLADLLDKNELLKDFKAVKEGNVWCTTPDFFQISNTMGYMINDISKMLTIDDGNDSELKYLFRLK
ncbi:MAG: ABC transporter substrate-binding protein [Oscillospiraceae bacterium]